MSILNRFFGLMLLTGTSLFAVDAGAQGGGCTMPDPPVFRATGHILDFADLSANGKTLVQDFESFGAAGVEPLLNLDVPEMVFEFSSGTRQVDTRNSEKRYLDPDHPGGQPNVPQSAWKRVNCVVVYDLLLMSVAKTDELVGQGQSLVIVALVGTDLHIRIFDPSGEKVIDKVEKELVDREITVTAFKQQLNPLPDASTLLHAEKQKIIKNATSIADHTQGAVPFEASRPDRQLPGATFRTMPNVELPKQIRATFVKTARSIFPDQVDIAGQTKTIDSFASPPGTNMLRTVFRNLSDTQGGEMLNTLPSTKKAPYNLHDGDPQAVRINPESPIDDLRYILETLYETVAAKPYRELLTRPDRINFQDLVNDAEDAADRVKVAKRLVDHHLQWGVDIIEGNRKSTSKVPGDRAYRGFALLNHSGQNRVKRVMPVYDTDGTVVGGEVTVRQIWYGGRIQSDTMFFDFGWNKVGPKVDDYANCGGGDGQPSQAACENAPPIPPNKPWTIHYEVHVLNRGSDDFSPMTMQFDCPAKLDIDGQPQGCPGPNVALPSGRPDWVNGPLYASLDQSFFPMEDGTKVSLSVKMAPPQYFNLTYTWGWRVHPPRAQAVENGQKVIPPPLGASQCEQAGYDSEACRNTPMMFCHPLRAGIIDHERFAFEGFPDVSLPPTPEALQAVGLATPDAAQFDACLKGFKKVVKGMCEDNNTLPICEAVGFPTIDDEKLGPAMINQRLGALKSFFPKPDPPLTTEREKMDFAISKISDLAPAKRMWRAFHLMQEQASKRSGRNSPKRWISLLLDARNAYLDWLDRTNLPSGLKPDQTTDLTLLFVNNTTYGELREGGFVTYPDWRRRGDFVRITLLNGDYFPHGYLNVDFGGTRGWENIWQSTIKTAGSGPWFTFGRFHAKFNTVPGSIAVDAATKQLAGVEDGGFAAPASVTPGAHRLMIQFNFEPTPRLRFYQFDPLHHDAAIYSLH